MSSATNDDQPSVVAQKRLLDHHQPWPTWDSLSSSLADLQARRPFFLELFAGKAGITEAVHLLRAPVLPPVDIELSDLVPTPRDVVDATVWAHIMAIIAAGLVFFLHCGIPHVTRSLRLASCRVDRHLCAPKMLLKGYLACV